jgi:hypothetical protein
MKKVLIILPVIFLAISCSNLSKNMVKKGTFSIKNGVYRNLSWKEELKLQRVSWYHELTLLYDLIYGSIDEKSKFYNWFSVQEQNRIKNCSDIILGVRYSLDSDRISHSMFDEMMRNANYEKISVPEFEKALRMHPDYKRLSLTLYKTQVYCRKSKVSAPVYINFPNFGEIKL